MKTKEILIIGGYGKVGCEVAKMLSVNSQLRIYIAGRNLEKANKVAANLHCESRFIDVTDKQIIEEALIGIDIIINCFISTNSIDSHIPEIVAKTGLKYIDVAGVPEKHLQKIKTLNDNAKKSGALLLTACGVNPGIVGIIIKHHTELLTEVKKTEVLFTMGSKFNDISVLSLMGIGDLMLMSPRIWKNDTLGLPERNSLKTFIGKPFTKNIFFSPAAITPDIIEILNCHRIESMKFWSGMESLWTSIFLYFSVKMGKTKTKEKSAKLLSRLKKMGSKKKYHSDTNLTIKSIGIKNNQTTNIESSFYCTEVFATALAPVITCLLMCNGKLNATGAYYALEVINPDDFISELSNSNIHFKEDISGQE